MKWSLLILPFLLFVSEPQKTVALNGLVVEQGTTRPIKEAAVQILNLEMPYRSTTDAQGRFILILPADVKRVRIRVTKDGYAPREDWIDVVSEIPRSPIELEKIAKIKPKLAPPSSQQSSPLEGRLFPSDESTPANYCSNVVKGDGIFILMGFVTSYVDQFPHTVLMVDDKPRLVVHKESDGAVWLSLDIFGADGKIIASLDEDGFTVRPGSYFKLAKKDKSSLRIVDEYNDEVLNVRYVNPHAIWFNALLRYPGSSPVSLKGSTGGGICTAHGGTAEINIKTNPESQEPRPPLISAPNGIAIGGGNVTNPTVNNFGPTPPIPTFELLDKQPLPESAAPQQWIRIAIDRTFLDPKFAVLCDRPCKVLRADLVFGPNGGSKQLSWGKIPNQENVAVISINQPNPMPSDDTVESVIASEDDKPVKILGVRVLVITPPKR